jgi:hypothetical protein
MSGGQEKTIIEVLEQALGAIGLCDFDKTCGGINCS